MKVVYTIVVVLLVLFIITFSLENTSPVQLRYQDFLQPFELPAYMLIFISFLDQAQPVQSWSHRLQRQWRSANVKFIQKYNSPSHVRLDSDGTCWFVLRRLAGAFKAGKSAGNRVEVFPGGAERLRS